MSTCVGLFLFTRIQIPDVMLTFTITLALWAFLRALDEKEERPRLWAAILAASLGLGLLLKSLVGIVFPIAAALIYLYVSKQLFSRRTWQRLQSHKWFSDRAAYRRALACVGHAAESALFCMDPEERSWSVPRILVVLFCK